MIALFATFAGTGGAIWSCGSNEGAGAGAGASSDAGSGGSGSGSQSTAALIPSGGTGTGGIEACAATEAEATFVTQPVDVILAIDNSPSMGAEIYEVEAQINANLANIIANANPPIDYRIILLSRYGDWNDNNICVSAPLGGTPGDATGHCKTIPTDPQNTARFFHHSISVGSANALCRLIDLSAPDAPYWLQPNGYGEVLRAGAFKTFVVITDDHVNCGSYDDQKTTNGGVAAAAAWDSDLLTLYPEHFGTESERNYVFHSIVALKPYDEENLALPYPPEAPIVCGSTPGEKCPFASACQPSGVNPGTGYQALSVLTGGLRYPTCGLDYTTIFQAIAAGVIKGSKLDCEFEIPDPPAGEELDLNTIVVEYTPGGAQTVTPFFKVDDEAACAAERFFVDGDKIRLCPDACNLVQADDGAQIKLKFGCAVTPPV